MENKFYDFITQNISQGRVDTICARCGNEKEFKYFIESETSFLDNKLDYNPTTSQRIWHIAYDIKHLIKCQECDNFVKFKKFWYGYNKTCCKKCQYGSKNFNKQKNTMIEKYGHENAFQVDEFKIKSIKTNQLNFGVDYPIQNSKIQEKQKNTNIKLYGVSNVKQSSLFQEKSKHSGFRLKNYILPSGKTIKLQGYENWALDELLKIYKEDSICYTDQDIEFYIGKIWYEKQKNKSRYFPDFYIKDNNTIIEVKSEYTFNIEKEEVLKKKNSCIKLGYNFELIVFNKKRKIINATL